MVKVEDLADSSRWERSTVDENGIVSENLSFSQVLSRDLKIDKIMSFAGRQFVRFVIMPIALAMGLAYEFTLGNINRLSEKISAAIADAMTGGRRYQQFGEKVELNWKPSQGEVTTTKAPNPLQKAAKRVKHELGTQYDVRGVDKERLESTQRYFAEIRAKNAAKAKPE